MINPRPVPPPLDAPMVDLHGNITSAWANFFNTIYRFQDNLDGCEDDGTYTVGIGAGSDGEITLSNGVITEITEASS